MTVFPSLVSALLLLFVPFHHLPCLCSVRVLAAFAGKTLRTFKDVQKLLEGFSAPTGSTSFPGDSFFNQMPSVIPFRKTLEIS